MATPRTRLPSPTKTLTKSSSLSQPHVGSVGRRQQTQTSRNGPKQTANDSLGEGERSQSSSKETHRSAGMSSTGTKLTRNSGFHLREFSPKEMGPSSTKDCATGVTPRQNEQANKPTERSSPQLKAPSRAQSASVPSTPKAKTTTTPAPGTGDCLRPQRNISTISQPLTTSRASQNLQSSQRAAKPTSRPAFTAYQQEFTPLKQKQLPQKPIRGSPSTPRKAGTQESNHSDQKYDPTQARAELHLLHLSLFHQEAPEIQQVYIKNAKEKLSAQFEDLYNLYTSTIVLERKQRQMANLLTLHAWTAGNIAVLSRKLNVLTGVLAELMRLTSPGGPNRQHSNNQQDASEVSGIANNAIGNEEPGEYIKCIANFEQWVVFVRSVWANRDAEATASTFLDGKTTDPESNDDHAVDARLATPGNQELHPPVDSYRQLEGLGDAVKSNMRALATQLNALKLKLQDLESGGSLLRFSPVSRPKNRTKEDAPDVEEAELKLDTPTPAYLLACSKALVSGMLEELQVMREVEFEVMVGEKAWIEERVRRIGVEVDGF